MWFGSPDYSKIVLSVGCPFRLRFFFLPLLDSASPPSGRLMISLAAVVVAVRGTCSASSAMVFEAGFFDASVESLPIMSPESCI